MRLGIAMLFVAGCGRFGFGSLPDDDGGVAATDLVVSIVDGDRLAGGPTIAAPDDLPAGTVGLSLREALVIAANRAGPDLIQFDRAMFPVTPAVTIAVASELEVRDDTTLDAYAAGVVVAPAPAYTGALLRVSGTGAVVDGLQLTGGTPAIVADSASGFVIRHVTVQQASGDGISITSCANASVDRAILDRVAGTPIAIVASTDVVVTSSFVALANKVGSVYGVHLSGSTRVRILDNIIDPGSAWLIYVEDSSDNEMLGNILDTGDSGVVMFGASHRNLVARNVIISPAYDSVYVDTGPMDNRILHNTMFMAGNPVDLGTNTQIANNWLSSTAADFVDPGTYDFHLVAGASAIDAAADLGLDLLPDRPERFLGSAPDLGGIESH